MTRVLWLFCVLLCTLPTFAQARPEAPPALAAALAGEWTGVLEYRDYSEPATSTKRVNLPTWLTVTPGANGLVFRYIYDDGPNKVLDESETVAIDPAARTYTETEAGKPARPYSVAGLEALKDGRGELVLTGMGTDNNKPAEMRVTLTVRRNLLTMVQESRAAGSAEAFSFRHRFVFTRAVAPKVTATR